VPRESPYKIKLTAIERQELERRAARYTLPYFQVLRAKMVLHAAEGWSNDEIARCLDTRREVVSQWRKRFFEQRLAGLEERPRPGRPRSFSPSSLSGLRVLFWMGPAGWRMGGNTTDQLTANPSSVLMARLLAPPAAERNNRKEWLFFL